MGEIDTVRNYRKFADYLVMTVGGESTLLAQVFPDQSRSCGIEFLRPDGSLVFMVPWARLQYFGLFEPFEPKETSHEAEAVNRPAWTKLTTIKAMEADCPRCDALGLLGSVKDRAICPNPRICPLCQGKKRVAFKNAVLIEEPSHEG